MKKIFFVTSCVLSILFLNTLSADFLACGCGGGAPAPQPTEEIPQDKLC